MPDKFNIGLEFTQQGAENIGDAYEAEIERLNEATEKATAEQKELAAAVGQVRKELEQQAAAQEKAPEKNTPKTDDEIVAQFRARADLRRRLREERRRELEEEKKGGLDPNLRRHWGSVVGNVAGFPGLGMLAAGGAGTAAAGIAISTLIQSLQHWLEQINAIVAASRQSDNVEQRIDSIGTRTRQVTLHNKDFALSYQDIARQVHSVAIAIQHMIELDHVAIEMAGKLDDAETRRALSLNNLQNMYNPVERIRQEEAIREAAYQRQVQREKDMEQLTLARKLQEFQNAGEREQLFVRQAKMVKEQLPELEKQADVDAERSKAVQEEEELKRKALEEERKIVENIALGKAGVTTAVNYTRYRTGVSQELNPATAASDALRAIVNRTSDRTSPVVTEAAQARLAELDEALKGTTENKQRAKQMAEESQGKVNRAKKRLGMAEDEIIKSQTEQQKAQLEAEQQDRVIQEKEKTRSQEERNIRESMQLERDIQIRQVSPPGSVPPSRGTALLDKVVELIELQKQTVAGIGQMNSTWNAG